MELMPVGISLKCNALSSCGIRWMPLNILNVWMSRVPRLAALKHGLCAAGVVCLLKSILDLVRLLRCFELKADDVYIKVLQHSRYALHAAIFQWYGMPDPVAIAVGGLEADCVGALRRWLGILARRRYFESLHRNRIGVQEALRLLEDLTIAAAPPPRGQRQQRWWQHAAKAGASDADPAEADTAAAPEQVQMPGTLEQAEAFLALEVYSDVNDAGTAEANAPSGMLRGILEGSLEPMVDQAPGDALRIMHRRRPVAATPSAPAATAPALPAAVAAATAMPAASSSSSGGAERRSVKKKTVAALLKEYGYSWKRQRKHLIFERHVHGRRQVFTQATTPSSQYSITKQLAELDRQQKQAEQLLAEMTSSAPGPSAPPASTVQPPSRKGKAGRKKK